jgi:hypothetical protein
MLISFVSSERSSSLSSGTYQILLFLDFFQIPLLLAYFLLLATPYIEAIITPLNHRWVRTFFFPSHATKLEP